MKKSIHYFLVEGQTEESLLDALLSKGRVVVFNMWMGEADKIVRKLGKEHRLYIVYDTDRNPDSVEQQRFYDNFDLLKKSSFSIMLLQQTQNLEDELCRVFSCGMQNLYNLFGAKRGSEFKEKFIAESHLEQKIRRQKNFDPTRLWNQKIISSLSKLRDFKKDYNSVKNLMKK